MSPIYINGVEQVVVHAAKHQDGGADEVSVAALSGTLADRQLSKAGDATLGWTNLKLLKGAGAGVAPTEIDVPAGIPSGLIAMWHGLIANIPSGWVICDGNNSTPNLLAKFVKGVATAATNPGATGGATSKTTAGHQHDLPFGHSDNTIFGVDVDEFGTGDTVSGDFKITQAAGATNVAAAKSKSQTDSIADIRPPFYDVAFIMKT